MHFVFPSYGHEQAGRQTDERRTATLNGHEKETHKNVFKFIRI